MEIKHDCFAKPRTFIPAVHPNGLKFQPDDDLKVFIVDADGNKIWEGTTRQAWNGKTNDGRPVPPGTYIYVIEDQCKGTIVLLR
jgi:flagellar hook assembly protein FlgD